ncbi:MAG: Threonylcarbamoyl-AMP synthase [Syntrophomonadaceae bacterium]|nr:Threonylcarbamoyl-AMP synthase [Bacillota bacterium]
MQIIKINATHPEPLKIRIAANVIRSGGLVAFPTETVYGLGAAVLDAAAVREIFKVKKRPFTDPLIVHIAAKQDYFSLADETSKLAERFMERFWPGPLTLIAKKSSIVPEIVTAGLNTVAIRMPAHKIALSLIKTVGMPVAAPSANLFGRPSPTTAQHVSDDFADKLELIIDGGRTTIGVESTVLDLTAIPPQILRPGGITREEIEETIGGKVTLFSAQKHGNLSGKTSVPSPGMMNTHYAPRAKLIFVEGDCTSVVRKVQKLADSFGQQGKKVVIMAMDESISNYNGFSVRSFGKRDDPKSCAYNLFSVLRSIDKEETDIIIAEPVVSDGLGLAVVDRLRKAATAIF